MGALACAAAGVDAHQERKSVKIRILPGEDNTNGWSAILPKRTPSPALTGDVTADWLVIGAGYAGLGVARRLSSLFPQQRIVVLDAGEVGENASGRNSGFAIEVPHNVGSSLAELEKAAQYQRLLAAGVTSLEQTLAQHGIDCDWQRRGKYHVAVSERTAEQTLHHHVAELKALGEPYELLDRAQLHKRIGTEYFHSGIYTPGCVLLNPAALSRGLADALPDNVSLHEHSAVTAIDYGATVHARTAGGSVKAPRVFLATNGMVPQFGFWQRQVFAMVSFGSLTQPLDARQRAAIGNVADWGLTPASAVTGATMRYTPDHRLLVRQAFLYAPDFRVSAADRARALQGHRDILATRFPALEGAQIAHFWAGTISMTRNGAPAWGRLASNVFAASGCNGVGILKQSIAGELLADFAAGQDNPLIADMQALGEPNRMPPRPLLDLGIRGYLAHQRWMGRDEY